MSRSAGEPRRGISRRPFVVFASVAVLVAACDPSHFLALRNDSDSDVMVRVIERFESFGPLTRVFAVPAHGSGVAFPPEIGELKGSVELLAADCTPIQRVAAQGGSLAIVGTDGSLIIRYTNNNDPNDLAGLRAIDACGGQTDEP